MARSFDTPGSGQMVAAIRAADSLEKIQQVVGQLPATAAGPNAVLYSGRIGEVRSESVAQELAKHANLSIINETPRAKFLADKGNEELIKSCAATILEKQGHTPLDASKMSIDFLYGNGKQPSHSPMSVEGCLWGKASKEFAESLGGNVQVVATTASPDRVFGKVEIPAAMDNSKIATLASIPMTDLRDTYRKGGIDSVLPEVQKPCVQAVQKGIYTSSGGTGVSLPKEFVETMGLDGRGLPDAARLSASGLKQANTGSPAVSITPPSPNAPDPSKTSSTLTAARRVESILTALRGGDEASVQKQIQTLANSDSARQMQSQAAITVNRQDQQQRSTQQQPAPQQTGPQPGQPDPSHTRAKL